MVDKKRVVAITGCTGFVGRHILPKLLDADYQVRALVRNPARLPLKHPGLTPVKGDLFTPDALKNLVEGAQSVIHLVGIIMELPRKGQTFRRVHAHGTSHLLSAANQAGIEHFVHMSALGTRENAVSDYHKTKYEAESSVRTSSIPYTIFRPSIIHGHDGEFMQMVKQFITGRFPPFIPYFAPGLFGKKSQGGRVQPIYIEDLAHCFVKALTLDAARNEIYPMGGPDEMTLPQMYQTCKKYLPGARKKNPRAVPVWYAKLIAGKPFVPFNQDQVIMSQENSTCQIGKLESDFDIKLAHFEPTFAQYAAKIQ